MSSSEPIISRYLKKLNDLILNERGYVFRGLKNSEWGLVSSARLRHGESITKETFVKYNCELVSDAKNANYHQKDNKSLTDIELLAELRHFGAATALIDFTSDFLIALWFASEPAKDQDGKVFCVKIDNTDEFLQLSSEDKKCSLEDILRFKTRAKKEENRENPKSDQKLQVETPEPELWFWQPQYQINQRLSSQKGVFVFGKPSISKKDLGDLKELTIKAEHKEAIRDELNRYHGINEESLFNDIFGFAEIHNKSHKISKTAQDYMEDGDRHFQQGNYLLAIAEYDKAIELNPQHAD